MPAHAARTGRVVGYTTAGFAIAATLLFAAGPDRARALVEPRSSATPSSATPPPSPVSDTTTATPSASPSPSHSRSGPYRVVGLGDSVPAGSVCDCTSYVSMVGAKEAARRGTTAAVTNLADNGLTTSDVLDQLADSSVRRQVAAADLVVITVGANDFDTDAVDSDACAAPRLDCFLPTLKEQQSQLDQVFERVQALLGDRSATVLATGYWNVFLDGEVAAAQGDEYVRNSVALTQAENTQIATAAQRHGATYVDIFTPFKGESGTKDDTSLLAGDGDHPNASGHRTIAEALESALDRS